jgi:hypothetical protein
METPAGLVLAGDLSGGTLLFKFALSILAKLS